MHTPFSRILTTGLFSGVMLLAFSTYSSAIISTFGDYNTVQGTVYAGNIPVPQCTVVVTPTAWPVIDPLPAKYLPQTTVTDANGHYSFSNFYDNQSWHIKAQKSGLGYALDYICIGGAGSGAGNQFDTTRIIDTLDLTLATAPPPPPVPTGKANIVGTVYEVIKPADSAMGTPAVMQAVPGCTVVVFRQSLPYVLDTISYFDANDYHDTKIIGYNVETQIYDTSTYRGLGNAPTLTVLYSGIAVTDANGHYLFTNVPIYKQKSPLDSIVVGYAKKRSSPLGGQCSYDVPLWAKKGGKMNNLGFYNWACLTDGQTDTTDITIAEFNAVAYAAGVAQHNAALKSLSTQSPAAVSMPLISSNIAAANVRISGNNLLINLPASQRLTIKAFRLNGQAIATIANNRFFSAGSQSLPAHVKYSGPMLIQVKGENVSFIAKVNSLRYR
ncbi:MAG: hypothetical protein PHC61_00475 [Chitinivibrionales bacterium]|nr:hypothetical protein [Chitinivibrionales bacterium]